MSNVSKGKPGDKQLESPAGGVELYRALRGLADEYRMRAVAEKDDDAAAIAVVLGAVVLHAAQAGVHVHLQVSTADKA
jgi:hypothetical protein